MKTLHIVRDEKFFDSAYRVFEAASAGQNDFVILGKKHKLFYIKQAKVKFIIPTVFIILRRFFLYKYDCIIIHGLHSEAVKLLVTKLSPRIKVLWIGWGFDYFRFWESNDYKPITFKNVGNTKKSPQLKKTNIFLTKINDLDLDQRFLNRVDYVSPVLDIEFDIFKKYYPKTNFQYIEWNYLTLEDDIINGIENQIIIGNNLLFGNSANPFNNHLDGFEDINLFKIKFDNIICPLSYGDRKNREIVIDLGLKLYGDRFFPITDFLDYSKYVKRLITCRYVFINSIRQLAMGNIVLMLYLGSYIILDKNNPVYIFFKKRNLQIFSIEEAKSGELPELDIEFTRKTLFEIWGRDAILNKTRILLDIIRN